MPNPAFMTLEGTKQGAIKGDCPIASMERENNIVVQAVEHEVTLPTDAATGRSTGKRIHKAFSILKEQDKASPLLYQALCTNELLPTVKIRWFRPNPAGDGTEEQYFTTELTDAYITSVSPYMPNCMNPNNQAEGHMEKVSFRYRKIVWRHEGAGTESQDDWNA